ncbi:extracellular solute-binding protein [Azoarcus olearius]|nr:extracellular solute-binding protein [Azoarcus olearius]
MPLPGNAALLSRASRTRLGAVLALVIGLLAATAANAEILRVVTWPGYADRDLVQTFELKHRVRVEVSYVGTDDVLWDKLAARGGADFDVFAVNTAELQRYIDGGLAAPVDPARIPNTARQLPRFRDVGAIAGLVRDGKVYGIPYTWSAMGLIYDRQRFASPPDSIKVLWDTGFRGQVLAFNGSSHNFSLAAQALGLPAPFAIGETDMPAVIDKLLALRRNVLTFYTLPEESVALFREQRVAVMFANYGSQQVQQLREAGINIGYVMPREGAFAWLDCWAISAGARNRRLAEAWINHMLDHAASRALRERQGLANTTDEANAPAAADRIIWLQPVEDVHRRAALWDQILSGDRRVSGRAP